LDDLGNARREFVERGKVDIKSTLEYQLVKHGKVNVGLTIFAAGVVLLRGC
jgi:hypothetical protein